MDQPLEQLMKVFTHAHCVSFNPCFNGSASGAIAEQKRMYWNQVYHWHYWISWSIAQSKGMTAKC
jgi:hypothetical protein